MARPIYLCGSGLFLRYPWDAPLIRLAPKQPIRPLTES